MPPDAAPYGGHRRLRRPRGRLPLLRRLRLEERRLHDTYVNLTRASKKQTLLPYAAEWLLDNFFVVERAIRQVREDLPHGYHRELPVMDRAPLVGFPRIYALAVDIVGDGREPLDLERVRRSILSYQQRQPLTTGELWALPTMLRWRMLENINAVAAHIVPGDEGDEETEAPDESEQTAVISNCIVSLRMLAGQDWRELFEAVSPVERILRRDPSGVYRHMDFETRDRYRDVVEELARRTGLGEEAVALEAVKLAEEQRRLDAECDQPLREGAIASRAAHIGYHLVDKGRRELERRVRYRPPISALSRRLMRRFPLVTYLGGSGLLGALIIVGLCYYATAAGGTLGQVLLVGALSVLPASAAAVNLINTVVTRILPARPLPRLDFDDGLDPENRTMVVIPALLSSGRDVVSLIAQLESHHVVNEDWYLHFGLLTDFADAPRETMPEDADLLRKAREGIEALNSKYRSGGKGPFYLFHRRRQWNPSEGCWMG
ncbi:MAG: hypothetical protein E3J64_06415, partial [Anaerolineales bacterium]